MQEILELIFTYARIKPDPESEDAPKIDGQIGYVSADGGIIKVEFSKAWRGFVVATGE